MKSLARKERTRWESDLFHFETDSNISFIIFIFINMFQIHVMIRPFMFVDRKFSNQTFDD